MAATTTLCAAAHISRFQNNKLWRLRSAYIAAGNFESSLPAYLGKNNDSVVKFFDVLQRVVSSKNSIFDAECLTTLDGCLSLGLETAHVSPNPGVAPRGGMLDLSSGCTNQPANNGVGRDFPVWYNVRWCGSGSTEIRVSYSIFYEKDGESEYGHR